MFTPSRIDFKRIITRKERKNFFDEDGNIIHENVQAAKDYDMEMIPQGVNDEDKDIAKEVLDVYSRLMTRIEEISPSQGVKLLSRTEKEIQNNKIGSSSHVELLENIKKEEVWKKRDYMLKKKIKDHKDRQTKMLKEEMEFAAQQVAKNQNRIATAAASRKNQIEMAKKEKQAEIQRMIKESRENENQLKSVEKLKIRENGVKWYSTVT